MQRMIVFGISVDPHTGVPVVLLKTEMHSLFLPIWIGEVEAVAILSTLSQATMPRPLTHDLLYDLLTRLGGTIARVEVTAAVDGAFHARLVVTQGSEELVVESRPSDAIALALRADAPVYVADEVLAEAGISFEEGDGGEEDTLAEFRHFLDHVDPDDFRRSG